MPAIFTHVRVFIHFWQPQQTPHSAILERKNLSCRYTVIVCVENVKGTSDWSDLYSGESEAKPNVWLLNGNPPLTVFFFFKTVCHGTLHAEFIMFLFPLQHLCHSEKGRKKACNCSFAPFSMKMDFLMWVSLHPRTLPNLIWSRTLLLYCHACYAHH